MPAPCSGFPWCLSQARQSPRHSTRSIHDDPVAADPSNRHALLSPRLPRRPIRMVDRAELGNHFTTMLHISLLHVINSNNVYSLIPPVLRPWGPEGGHQRLGFLPDYTAQRGHVISPLQQIRGVRYEENRVSQASTRGNQHREASWQTLPA